MSRVKRKCKGHSNTYNEFNNRDINLILREMKAERQMKKDAAAKPELSAITAISQSILIIAKACNRKSFGTRVAVSVQLSKDVREKAISILAPAIVAQEPEIEDLLKVSCIFV